MVSLGALNPAIDQSHERYEATFAAVEAPFAFVDLDAMAANAAEMLGRAGGKPIRVASKSLRCRALQERVLRSDPGFAGQMTFTLPETLWLAEQGFENLLLAYPTADTGALGDLALVGHQRGELELRAAVDLTGEGDGLLDRVHGRALRADLDPAAQRPPARVDVDADPDRGGAGAA